MSLVFGKEQRMRVANLVVQLSLLSILGFTDKIPSEITWLLVIWQIMHYQLIALSDYYLDDYQKKNQKLTFLLYSSFLLFIVLSIFYGVFEKPYIRIHYYILIAGNLLGNKVDKPFWVHLTLIHIVILAYYEYSFGNISSEWGVVIAYVFVSIFMLALAERLSEYNRSIWLAHASVHFLWIYYQGWFYQEAIMFQIGSISYVSNKLLAKQI